MGGAGGGGGGRGGGCGGLRWMMGLRILKFPIDPAFGFGGTAVKEGAVCYGN